METNTKKTLAYTSIIPKDSEEISNRRSLVLLHGYGSHMGDLAGLAPMIGNHNHYFCLNAPIELSFGYIPGSYSWFDTDEKNLETITNYDLPVKVLLLNNSGDGMVKQWQKLYYGGRLSASDKTLHTKDFIMSAKSDGFQFAERLSEQSKVEETIERFINFEKAAFLEVVIDPDAMVFPMIGPGMSYDQMITGPFMDGKDPDPEIDGNDPKSMF